MTNTLMFVEQLYQRRGRTHTTSVGDVTNDIQWPRLLGSRSAESAGSDHAEQLSSHARGSTCSLANTDRANILGAADKRQAELEDEEQLRHPKSINIRRMQSTE